MKIKSLLEKLKAIFKVAIVFCLYKVDFSLKNTRQPAQDLWNFKMIPRKFPTVLSLVIFSPVIAVVGAIHEIMDFVSDRFKIQSWSSYELREVKGKQPSKIEAYKKFKE